MLSGVLAAGLAGAALLLPEWAAAGMLPFLMALEGSEFIPPLGQVGAASLRVQDVLFLLIILRTSGRLATRPQTVIPRDCLIFGGFVCVLSLATLAAWWRGETGASVTALGRFALQGIALVATAISMKAPAAVRRLLRMVGVFGTLAALSIYVDAVLFPLGMALGEVQGEYADLTRFFGIVGDQVGFLLVYYILSAVAERRPVRGLFFGGALYLTSTIGAFLCAGVGLAYLALASSGDFGARPVRRRLLAIGVAAFACVVFVANLGTAANRLTGGNLFVSGSGLQRVLTAQSALQVVGAYPVLGVGYLGFDHFAPTYGVVEAFVEVAGRFSQNFTANAGNQFLQTLTDAGVLGAAALAVVLVVFCRTTYAASRPGASPLSVEFLGVHSWLVALAIGNQSAAWLLPSSTICVVALLLVGAAAAMRGLPAPDTASPGSTVPAWE